MSQQTLFYEGFEHACEVAATHSGKTFKQIAMELWPAKRLDSAYANLKAVLDHNQAHKFSPDEIIHFCTICGQYDPLYYLCDSMHHSRPHPVAPEDEKAQLMQDFVKAQRELAKLVQRMNETETRLKAVG